MQRPRRNLAKPSSSSAPHCVRITLNAHLSKVRIPPAECWAYQQEVPAPSLPRLPFPTRLNQIRQPPKHSPMRKRTDPASVALSREPHLETLEPNPGARQVRLAHRWSIRTACRRTVSLRPAGPRRPLPLDPALGLRGLKLRIIRVM